MAETRIPLKKVILWVVVVGLLLAVTAYVVARAQGAAELETLREEMTEEKRQLDVRIGELQGELARIRIDLQEAERKITMLEARRQLGLAVDALDDRNFGTAQDHVVEGTRLLKDAVQPGQRELTDFVGHVEEFEVEVAQDLEGQRQRLHRIVHRFDELVPPPGDDLDDLSDPLEGDEEEVEEEESEEPEPTAGAQPGPTPAPAKIIRTPVKAPSGATTKAAPSGEGESGGSGGEAEGAEAAE